MREVALLAALVVLCIHQSEYAIALAFSICLVICTFFSVYKVDDGTAHLATREKFLKLGSALDSDDQLIDTDSECRICYEPLSHPVRLRCGHIICQDCVKYLFGPKWNDNRCPWCRIPLFAAPAPWNNEHAKTVACAALLALVGGLINFGWPICTGELPHRRGVALVSDAAVLVYAIPESYLMYKHMGRDEDDLDFWKSLVRPAVNFILAFHVCSQWPGTRELAARVREVLWVLLVFLRDELAR